MRAGLETIEVVRGKGSDSTAPEILDFLTGRAGLNAAAARKSASEAVCVALIEGEIIGVGAASPAGVQLIGGRRFWVYRSFLAQDSAELWSRLFNSAFEALASDSEESGGECVGVCTMIGDPSLIARRPEAVWPDTELILAGFLDDGRQLRIRYFWGAAIGPGLPGSPPLEVTRHHDYPLDERYRIQPLAEDGSVTAADVLRLWAEEGALSGEEAAERVREVTLVATERDDGVVGISSLYLGRNPQLRMPLWHYRTYVAGAHRMSNLAAQLIFANRDLMEERFVRGEDTRAGGMIFELQNEGMKKYFNKALWLPADFTFIGENARGDHVRVHYFPGAHVPAISPAAT